MAACQSDAHALPSSEPAQLKGRRRARRVALQALYELDQSQHPLDTVLVGRVRDFVTTAIEGGLPPSDQPAAYRLLDHLDPHGLVLPALADLRPLLEGMNGAAPAAHTAPAAATPDHHLERAYQFLSELVDQLRYADVLVRGVWASRAVLDKTVAQIAPEWPVDQMAPIDRNVLRVALWETSAASAPPKVAISEAVELARLFAGEASRRMVNGALGSFVGHGEHLRLPSVALVAPTPDAAVLSSWHGADDAEEAESAADVVEVAEEGEADGEGEGEGEAGEREVTA